MYRLDRDGALADRSNAAARRLVIERTASGGIAHDVALPRNMIIVSDRVGVKADGGGTMGPMSPSGAVSRSTMTGA